MQITFKVTNQDGIHARPATALVNTANKFQAEIFAEAGDRKVTMKSILGVLSFDLEAGDTITFHATGDDAAEALAAIQEIFAGDGLGVVL